MPVLRQTCSTTSAYRLATEKPIEFFPLQVSSLASLPKRPHLFSSIPHVNYAGDMAAIVAPIKATAAAAASVLAQETKSLFADVRNCRAAVTQLQVTRVIIFLLGQVIRRFCSACCSAVASAAISCLQFELP